MAVLERLQECLVTRAACAVQLQLQRYFGCVFRAVNCLLLPMGGLRRLSASRHQLGWAILRVFADTWCAHQLLCEPARCPPTAQPITWQCQLTAVPCLHAQAQAPGLPYQLPRQLAGYPALTGRAIVELTVEKASGQKVRF